MAPVASRIAHGRASALAPDGSGGPAAARSQRFAERFGARYTPAVVAIAAGVAVIGPLAGGSVREWIYRALVVLVVSCSCALVISVPTAVVAAVTRGARDGILIRGGAFLEALAAVRTVAFDKTGTLTEGRPRLTDIVSLNGVDEADVLRLAAGVGVHALLGAERLFVGRPAAITIGDVSRAGVRKSRIPAGFSRSQLANNARACSASSARGSPASVALGVLHGAREQIDQLVAALDDALRAKRQQHREAS